MRRHEGAAPPYSGQGQALVLHDTRWFESLVVEDRRTLASLAFYVHLATVGSTS